jgi:translation initiation factor IF-2
MTEEKTYRLSQVARKLNVGSTTIVEYLSKKGFEVESNPNAKISMEQYNLLAKEYADSAMEKEEASHLTIGKKHGENMVIDANQEPEEKKKEDDDEIFIKTVSPVSSAASTSAPKESSTPESKPKVENEDEKILPIAPRLQGPKVIGKIDLDKPKPKPEPEPEKKPVEAEAPKVEVKPEPKAPEAPKIETPEPVKVETPKPPVAEVKAPEVTESPKAPEVKAPEAKAPEKVAPAPAKPAAEEEAPQGVMRAEADKLKGLSVVGKIELPAERPKKKPEPAGSSDDRKNRKKRKRKVVSKDGTVNPNPNPNPNAPRDANADRRGGGGTGPRKPGQKPSAPPARRPVKEEPTDKEIQEKIKATLARLSGSTGKGGTNRSKYRRDKRSAAADAEVERVAKELEDAKILKVTEFISANDLASMMDVSVNAVISTCLSLGMFVSINQRLDAEAITVIADEFGYNVEFISTEDELTVEEEADAAEDLEDRPPIVTIMGHVDHGKTSLLDYIRKTKVTAGEAGGITQHIGAYSVNTTGNKRIAFLDTPGHEAFTAMRARGAKITDIVIIVVAADDAVMPQTKEAINHAMVAGVPIVIAINKIDRPNANPNKIKEELSAINVLVEDWGGKYQCQEISAKTGLGIDDLLEKVLLEAEILELKSNPNKLASGTVVEASLDKGRGYVATVMVQNGTMKVGDILLAGSHYGRVKAMFNHLGEKLKKAGPATPVLVLGLDGAPQAGDKFNVMETERDARDIANKREQILREQSMRTKKHITLDEIGRRLAIGSFKELNLIVKGDVDGSVEALSDSLLKLSNEEVNVNIIHRGVGQISESDVLLASASDAVIVAFQVRPSTAARKLAEQEEIEIRMYSIIYDAINEIKDAIEGMLSPEVEEVITGIAEVREVFKISKIGTVAGCMMVEGTLSRKNQIRLIRDGIVIYTGDLGALKRFKDDVNEVRQGFECGMSIKNFNDIKVGDSIEGFTTKETKRKL